MPSISDLKTMASKTTESVLCGAVAYASYQAHNYSYDSAYSLRGVVPASAAIVGLLAARKGGKTFSEDVWQPLSTRVINLWNNCKKYFGPAKALTASCAIVGGTVAWNYGESWYGPMCMAGGAATIYANKDSIKESFIGSQSSQPLQVISDDQILHFDGPHFNKLPDQFLTFTSIGAAFEAYHYADGYLERFPEYFTGKSAEEIRGYVDGTKRSGFSNADPATYNRLRQQLLESMLMEKFAFGTKPNELQLQARRELLATAGQLVHPAVAGFSEQQMTMVYKEVYRQAVVAEQAKRRPVGLGTGIPFAGRSL